LNNAKPASDSRWWAFSLAIFLKVSIPMSQRNFLLTTMFLVGVVSAPLAQAQSQAPINQNPAAQAAPAARVGVVRQTQTQVTQATGDTVAVNGLGIRIGRRFNCLHVIDLLVRKAQFERFGGGIVEAAPIVHGGFGQPVLVQPQLGDLELISVGMVADATPDAAPIYGVTLRNNSRLDLCRFSVSAVAVHGAIDEFSPTVSQRIDKLCAGESVTIEMQLPFAALAMGHSGQRCCFDKLVVAIDAFDEFLESNELNNILILQKTAITLIETQTTETTETVTGAAPVATNPAVAPEAAAPNATAPIAPNTPENSSPIDSIDFDNFDSAPTPEATPDTTEVEPPAPAAPQSIGAGQLLSRTRSPF